MTITICKTFIETTIKAKVTVSSSEIYPTDEQKSGDIFTLIIEESGRFEMRSADWAQSFHSVAAYVLGPKSSMLNVYKKLSGVPESICSALCKDPTLNSGCDTFENATYQNATLNIAGVDYVGYKISVNNIKIPRTL